MLKFVIVGLVLTMVSSAPLDSVPTEKPIDSHTHIELVRPSPINPDIPMDPKPPERIILDDGKTERDTKSLSEKTTTVEQEPQEHLKIEASTTEHSDENNQEKNNETVTETMEKSENDDKKPVPVQYNHDDVSDDRTTQTNVEAKESLQIKAKESSQPAKSDEPIIVYAVKADAKQQRSESFQTSHRIPGIEESERKFETSHHIPSHIDNERTKLVETSKVDPKELN